MNKDIDIIPSLKEAPSFHANYLFIPVELCANAISKKFIRPFQLYVYLKSICSGKIKLAKSDLNLIADALGLKSIRTVKNNINILLQRNWIGFNKESGYYFIRGFEKVKAIYGFKSTTNAEFAVKDIQKFKGFIAGAVIGFYVNQQRRRKWVIEHYKGGSKHITHTPSFFPVANLALAKILNISISTASQYKALARKARFIKLKRNFTALGVSAEYRNLFKKANPEMAHRVLMKEKKLVLQDSDTVLPMIRFRNKKNNRKKTDTLIKGFKGNL